jgi:hypothetical protein
MSCMSCRQPINFVRQHAQDRSVKQEADLCKPEKVPELPALVDKDLAYSGEQTTAFWVIFTEISDSSVFRKRIKPIVCDKWAMKPPRYSVCPITTRNNMNH